MYENSPALLIKRTHHHFTTYLSMKNSLISVVTVLQDTLVNNNKFQFGGIGIGVGGQSSEGSLYGNSRMGWLGVTNRRFETGPKTSFFR